MTQPQRGSADRRRMRMKNRTPVGHDNTISSPPQGVAAGKQARTEAIVQRKDSAEPSTAPILAMSEPGVDMTPRADESFVESLVGHSEVRRTADPTRTAGADVHELAASGVAGSGARLPFLDSIQASFGAHDVAGVKAHTDENAAAAAKGMGATAFASGDHVAFAGAPDLHTAAHAAAPVVQQRGGVNLKSGVGQEGDAYEQHADAVADAVVRGESAEPVIDQMVGPRQGSATSVQRKAKTPATSEFSLLESIRYLEERASELLGLGAGTKGPREGNVQERASDVALAADMVTDQLRNDASELDERTQSALRHVARNLILVQALGGPASVGVRGAAQRLASAAKARGVELHAGDASIPGTALGGDADDGQLLDSLANRIGQLVAALGAHAESPGLAQLVGASASSILPLMRQVEGVVRGADTRDLERFSAQVMRISSHIDLLFRRARQAKLGLAESTLDDVFETEDRLLRTVGAESENRVSKYFGDARLDPGNPMTSGAALIDSIVAHMTNSALVHESAISDVANILHEPERAPPTSLLAEILQSVVSDFIGGLPGRFGKMLERVAVSMSTKGGATSASGTQAAAPTGSFIQTGLFNTAKKIVAFGAGEAKGEASGAFGSDDGRARPEMKTKFIEECHARLVAYMAGPLHDQALDLKHNLMMRVPPEQLAELDTQMAGGLRAMVPGLVQDLLAQWMNFRAGAALGGTDEHGDLMMNGALDDVVAHTGSISMDVNLPDAEVRAVRANGISPAVLRKLGKIETKITDLPVHRFIRLYGPPTAGGRESYGEIYINARGELRTDRVHDRTALAIVGRGGDLNSLLGSQEPPSESDVEAGARALLRRIAVTTERLQ